MHPHEPWLVQFVNTRWPVLAVAALLLPAWSLRMSADKLEAERKAQLVQQLETLTVTVVAGRPARPVKDAVIRPIYTDEQRRPLVTVDSRGNGQYEFGRKRQALVLYISNAEGTQAAIAEVRRDQSAVTVALVPVVAATGRLVREDTGEPLANVEIEWDLTGHRWQSWTRGPHPPGAGGQSRTSADGSFRFPEVFAEADYRVTASLEVPHFGRTVRWHTSVIVRIDADGPTELGNVRVPEQPSLEERFAADFELKSVLTDRLARAQQAAGQHNQRVLAVLANPRDEAAFELRQSFHSIEALAHYRVVWISIAGPAAEETGRWADERNLLINPLDAGLLVVLNEQGEAIGHLAVQGVAFGGESGDRLIAFLDQHDLRRADAPVGQ